MILRSPITDFIVRDSVLLTVNTDVLNGQFAFTFNLPYEMSDEYGTLKFSYYAKDFPMDARGQFADIDSRWTTKCHKRNEIH